MMAVAMSFVSCSKDEPDKKKDDDKKTTVYVAFDVKINPDSVNCDLEQYSLSDEMDKLSANATTIMKKIMTDQGGTATDYSTQFTFKDMEEKDVKVALQSALTAANSSLANAEPNLAGKYTCSISSSTTSFYECTTFATSNITLAKSLFETFTADGLKYQVLPNNHAAVVTTQSLDFYKDCDYSGDITVPATVANNGKTYTVTTVGPKAFYAGEKITSISLPSTITTICMDAFEYNKALTKINIPGSVKTFIKGKQTTTSMFRGQNLTDITLEEGLATIPEYAFMENDALTSISIPSTLTKIPNSCFSECTGLSKVVIANGVKEIGNFSFSQTPVTDTDFIPASVTTIGQSAFSSCKSLATVDLKDGITTIGNDAFSSTSALTKATIPATVTSLGAFVFGGSSVTEIHFKGSTPATLSISGNKDTFSDIPSTCKIYVPSASVDAYKKANIWSNYASQIVGE